MLIEEFLPALKLIGWCRNIGDGCVQRFSGSIFKPAILQTLRGKKLLRPHDPTYGWRLTKQGYRLLAEQGFPCTPDPHTQRPGRRFQYAELIVTMYASGIDPFLSRIEQLRKGDAYLPASALRAQPGMQMLGSNQTAGLLRLGDTLFAAHYLAPSMNRLVSPRREEDCLDGLTVGASCKQAAYLFCGASYNEIYSVLHPPAAEENEPVSRRRRKPYAAFYEMAAHPVCLLPCSHTGVMQLRMLRQPNYRAALTRLYRKEEGINDAACPAYCDFIRPQSGVPVRFAADMDLHGIERAAFGAKQAGHTQIILAAFGVQLRFLKQYYRPPFYRFTEMPEYVLDMLKGGGHASV